MIRKVKHSYNNTAKTYYIIPNRLTPKKFAYPQKTFRRAFVGNLITVKKSLKIRVNSSGSKKVFMCTYIKASVNRQGLGIFFFFLHFCLSEINLLQVKEQIGRLLDVHPTPCLFYAIRTSQ